VKVCKSFCPLFVFIIFDAPHNNNQHEKSLHVNTALVLDIINTYMHIVRLKYYYEETLIAVTKLKLDIIKTTN